MFNELVVVAVRICNMVEKQSVSYLDLKDNNSKLKTLLEERDLLIEYSSKITTELEQRVINRTDELAGKVKELSFQRLALDQHAIVSTADKAGNITYVNDKFCAVSGYSEQELIGNNHRMLNSDEHSKQFFKSLWQTISKGDTWKGEIKNKKKGGGYYWVDVTIVPFLDENSNPFQYVAIRDRKSVV